MNKQQREIYRVLSDEIDWNLCGFCRYHQCYGSSCCDGGAECMHPIEKIASAGNWDTPDDCWGFRPNMKVGDVADIVGLVLANHWQPQRVTYWLEGDGSITIQGRT